MKLFKFIPLILVGVYFGKCMFKAASFEDAIILISLTFLSSIYAWIEKNKSNDEFINRYKELEEYCKKELETKNVIQTKILTDIDNLKSSVASVKMSAGFTTRTLNK